MPTAEEEEGRAGVPGRKMERGSEGGDPTSGRSGWHREKEKVKGKGTRREGRVGTRGQNVQVNEAALRYWLQMAAVTQAEAGGGLRDIAAT